VKEQKILPFWIESAKYYAKNNWLILFAYHYLINAKDGNHCKKKHPELQKLSKSMLKSNALNMVNRIIDTDIKEKPEIEKFNNLKYN